MDDTTSSRLAWGFGLIAIVLLLGAIVVMYVDRGAALPGVSSVVAAQWNFANVLNDVVNIGATAFGILLAARRPRNPIGWLFLGAGLALGLSGFGAPYAIHALLVDPGSLPAGRMAAWLSNATALIPLAVLCFLFLLFPTGHLPTRRWRSAAWFVGGAFGLVTAAFITFATIAWRHPFEPVSSASPLWALLPLLIVASLALSLAAVVVRFRRSVGEERLQLKWFATGAAVVVGCLIPTFFSNAAIWLVLQSLAFLVLFGAVAVAVLKYRLYDIDVVINKTVVYASLAAFFTAVYVAVVVGLGTAIGSTHDPFLTVVAASVIAIAFNPVRERAKRLADRLVYGKRATPYEVLSQFAERMAGGFALDDILPRMARVLAEGTGGQAEIWLRVGQDLHSVAAWPAGDGWVGPADLAIHGDEPPAFPAASKTAKVLHQGELLGVVTVSKPANDPIRPGEDKLIEDVASQAGLVLFNVRLVEELRASRQRLVKAQDEERRKIERNIHDGAQQQLVALSVKARLAGTLAERDPARSQAMLAEIQFELGEALDDLRDLARGIYPPLLADQGLAAALSAQARKSSVPVTVEANGIGRYPQEIEAAIYFCCLEALQNVAKYAQANAGTVRLFANDGVLSFEVSDDGIGFDPDVTDYGTGLQGMADRLDALGGSLEVRSRPHEGTTLVGRIPG